ncbi:hypothetical protein STEG23_029402 [Scotinomys teguina]
MDKENVVHIHNGVLCSRENNDIMKFAGKWMELENVILSKEEDVMQLNGENKLDGRRARQIDVGRQKVTHVWKLRNCLTFYIIQQKENKISLGAHDGISNFPLLPKKSNNEQGSLYNLLGIMEILKDGLQTLANTLEVDKELNTPKELSTNAEKE